MLKENFKIVLSGMVLLCSAYGEATQNTDTSASNTQKNNEKPPLTPPQSLITDMNDLKSEADRQKEKSKTQNNLPPLTEKNQTSNEMNKPQQVEDCPDLGNISTGSLIKKYKSKEKNPH